MINYEGVNSLDLNFNRAATNIKKITITPDNDELLILYGLYKQAKFGNNATSEPPVWQIKEKSKWRAWTNNNGKSMEQAKNEYIEFVYRLFEKYN